MQHENLEASVQQLALYTGNILKSVSGRNSVNKKTNMEVSKCYDNLNIKQVTLTLNKILEAIRDTLNYGDNLNYGYDNNTKLIETPNLRSSSRIDPKDRDHVEITGMQL